MQGPNLYVMRVMGIFVNLDRIMGKPFEDGLANLKTVAEHGLDRWGPAAEKKNSKLLSWRHCHLPVVEPWRQTQVSQR